VKVEVINTGTELLLGNVTNTHLAFFGEALFALGLRVQRQVCVPDGPPIREALSEAFTRADVVLVTGGLGPTSDDVTRDVAAELLGLPMETNPEILEKLRAFFKRLQRPFYESSARQAQVPQGATVIDNRHGTAPGLYLPPRALGGDKETRRSPHLFLLPGPPRELRPMFTQQVAPMLAAMLPADEPRRGCKIYRAIGIGESQVEALVGEPLLAIDGLELGYCARLGEVDVRCIGTPDLLARAEAIVLPALQSYLLPGGALTIEEGLVHRLKEMGRTIAVAESCTGGFLAHRLTNVPGASSVFLAGLTTYSNAAKTSLLGVDAGLIKEVGAVSAEVAAAMAAGTLRVTGADYALATTGEAGPESGEGKPVGTLFVALAKATGGAPQVEESCFALDREGFKRRASQVALDLLRRNL
jgi:nicotinamide-nucleotide amidase